MSLYKRGDVWWYKFCFNGQLIRESSKSNSKTVSKDAERARRRELEQAYNRILKREQVPLFSHAAEVWLANKAGLAPMSTKRYEQCVAHLKEHFGKGLVCDEDANDISEYRSKRLAVGVSNRTVNYEVADKIAKSKGIPRYAQRTHNPLVVGSNPTGPTTYFQRLSLHRCPGISAIVPDFMPCRFENRLDRLLLDEKGRDQVREKFTEKIANLLRPANANVPSAAMLDGLLTL
jgi:hypothetical protein